MNETSLSRARLAELTLEALKAGCKDSRTIRDYIANKLGMTFDPKTVNVHAWALVDLQAKRTIIKVGQGSYRLAYAVPTAEYVIEPPTLDNPPRWARNLMRSANRSVKAGQSNFQMADLLTLWKRGQGRCEVTGGHFSNEAIGRGLVKRAFAPSLDRIDHEKPYTLDNCRLVMVAVNFAMNTWGEDTFLQLAKLTAHMRA